MRFHVSFCHSTSLLNKSVGKGAFSVVLDGLKNLADVFLGWFGTDRDTVWSGIKEFYNGRINAAGKPVGGLDYYTPEDPTIRHELHPMGFTLESDTQEPMIQTILQLRRLVTMHEGLRMQDVKRYGMTIYRIRLNKSNELEAITDTMDADDPRSAIQLPVEVLSAGMQANPRNTTTK